MFNLKKLAVVMAVAASSATVQAAVIVDLFNGVPIQSVTDTTLTTGPSAFDPITGAGSGLWATGGLEANPLSLLGGQRDMYIEWTVDALNQGDTLGTPRIAVTPAGGNGYLSISNADGHGGTAALRWDGMNSAADGDSSLNMGLSPLALSPTDFFLLDIISSDHPFGLDLYMFTSTTTYSKVSVTGNIHNSPFSQAIPIGAFADCDNSISGGITTCYNGNVVTTTDFAGVDFNNVGALMAVVKFNNGGANQLALDITLNSVTVPVPEPGSIALVGAALLGLGAASRRRLKK